MWLQALRIHMWLHSKGARSRWGNKVGYGRFYWDNTLRKKNLTSGQRPQESVLTYFWDDSESWRKSWLKLSEPEMLELPRQVRRRGQRAQRGGPSRKNILNKGEKVISWLCSMGEFHRTCHLVKQQLWVGEGAPVLLRSFGVCSLEGRDDARSGFYGTGAPAGNGDAKVSS